MHVPILFQNLGVSGRNWVKLGKIRANLGVIGGNWEKKETKYGINRSAKAFWRGSAPQKACAEPEHASAVGLGVFEDVLAVQQRLDSKKNGKKWAKMGISKQIMV